jgi:hypothetical protein
MNNPKNLKFAMVNLGSEPPIDTLRSQLEQANFSSSIKPRNLALYSNHSYDANFSKSPDANGNFWLEVFARRKNFESGLLLFAKKLAEEKNFPFYYPFAAGSNLAQIFPLVSILEKAFLLSDTAIKSSDTGCTKHLLDSQDEEVYLTDYTIIEKSDGQNPQIVDFILVPHTGPFASLYRDTDRKNEILQRGSIKKLADDPKQIWFEAIMKS